MRNRPTVLALASLLVIALAGCSNPEPTTSSPTTEPEPDPDPKPDPDASEDEELVGTSETVSTELPAELVAELRLRGSDVDGRLLTLAPGFIATAACSDCGAPSYLWFVAVRCVDTHHCEVLTEQCQGKISREAERYELEFRVVEGGAEASTEVCAGYTGTFEAAGS